MRAMLLARTRCADVLFHCDLSFPEVRPSSVLIGASFQIPRLLMGEPWGVGCTGAKDDPHGGVDLISYYGLRRLYDQLATRGLDPVNYLRGVPGDSELRR